MKTLIAMSLLLLNVTANAAQTGQRFDCLTSSGQNDHISIEGCVNKEGNKLMACKNQDSTYLGTPYLKLEKIQFSSGYEISAPVKENVLIPAKLVSVNIKSGLFEIKIADSAVGTLEVRAPADPTNPNGKKNGDMLSAPTLQKP